MIASRKLLVLLFFKSIGLPLAQHIRSGHLRDRDIKLKQMNLGNDVGAEAKIQINKSSFLNNGVCWVHRNGEICMQNGSIRFITYDEDVANIQEIINGMVYTYNKIVTKSVRLSFEFYAQKNQTTESVDMMKSIGEQWIEPLEKVKYNCRVGNSTDEITPIDLNDMALIEIYHDRSSLWKMAEWIVNVDRDMVPISISDEDENPFLFISGVRDFTGSITGCNKNFEGGAEDSIPYTGPDEHRILTILQRHQPSIRNNNERALNAKSDVYTYTQALMSDTQWCGTGTNLKKTPCPDKSLGYDYYADSACRRHDHGKKTQSLGFAVRSECNVDKGLVEAGGHNWAIQGIFGELGLAQTWGCYEHGKYKCWKTKEGVLRYGDYCKGTHIRYGPNRYNDRNWKWGYKNRRKSCANDLPFKMRN